MKSLTSVVNIINTFECFLNTVMTFYVIIHLSNILVLQCLPNILTVDCDSE